MEMNRKEDEFPPNEFFDIVKKAYDRGVSEHGLTLQQLLDDLKNDLLKLKA
ncbi:hypothetical protein [Neobacillus niacini]|uniref:hypothetical protein n=1 Tax=Neobacillus niacini TaxID=86668 RepID=UPI0039834ACB